MKHNHFLESILKYLFTNSRVGKREFHPQASHGTVLEDLPSHGS